FILDRRRSDCESICLVSAHEVRREQSVLAIKACVEGSKPQDIPSDHKNSARRIRGSSVRYVKRRSPRSMSAPLMHIESSPSLPQEADVVVIGGGVVGVFTAYYLARRGVKVALL